MYTPLRKLYYQSEEKYKEVYQSRLHSEETTHIDFEVNGNRAFFVNCTDVTNYAMKVLRLDKEISTLTRRLPPVALDQYAKKCLIDEIVLTNQIEGVHSTRKEVGETLDILEQQTIVKKGKRQRFIGLINHYLKLRREEEIEFQNCRQIRSIYDEIVLEEVLAEDKGNAPDGKFFRKDQTTVQSVTGKVIHRGITPESKIIEAVDRALHFLNDESIDILFRACLFHYLIEYIHPFYDGNGRLGRFIFSYYISKSLDPLVAYRISETIKASISEYYEAFETCNDERSKGDLTPFLIMMLHMLVSAMEDLKGGLNRRLTNWERYEQKAYSIYDTNNDLGQLYSYLIQAALFSEGGISRKELLPLMNVGDSKLLKLLREVEAVGLLETTRDRSGKKYRLNLNQLDQIIENKLNN